MESHLDQKIALSIWNWSLVPSTLPCFLMLSVLLLLISIDLETFQTCVIPICHISPWRSARCSSLEKVAQRGRAFAASRVKQLWSTSQEQHCRGQVGLKKENRVFWRNTTLQIRRWMTRPRPATVGVLRFLLSWRETSQLGPKMRVLGVPQSCRQFPQSWPGLTTGSIRWLYAYCQLVTFNMNFQSWSLWYNRGDSSLSWAENQKVQKINSFLRLHVSLVQMVGTVRTAEEFWQVQQLLSPPSVLPVGVDLALFRAGVTLLTLPEETYCCLRWRLIGRMTPTRQVDGGWLGGSTDRWTTPGSTCSCCWSATTLRKRPSPGLWSAWERQGTSLPFGSRGGWPGDCCEGSVHGQWTSAIISKTTGGKDSKGKAGIARAWEAAVQPAQVHHIVCST